MRRAGRILFNGLAVLSLVLAVVAAVLWVRSRFARDLLYRDANHWAFQIESEQGAISFGVLRRQVLRRSLPAAQGYVRLPPVSGTMYVPEWKHAVVSGGANSQAFWFLTIPDWLILATAMPASAIAISSAAKRRRRVAGHCPACGYDLRATPDRCPECGREAQPAVLE